MRLASLPFSCLHAEFWRQWVCGRFGLLAICADAVGHLADASARWRLLFLVVDRGDDSQGDAGDNKRDGGAGELHDLIHGYSFI